MARGAVLMHVPTNNAEKDGTSANVGNLKSTEWTDYVVGDITSNWRQG